MTDPIDHLDYEVEMLVETYARAAAETDRISRNAFIESFCTHARLIFELFEKEAKAPKYSRGYVPIQNPAYHNKILNNQISHLGNLRTHDDAKKIDHAVRTDMIDRIRADLAHFKAHMIDQQKAALIRDVPAQLVITPSGPSATNAVQTSTISSTTTTTSHPIVTGTVHIKT